MTLLKQRSDSKSEVLYLRVKIVTETILVLKSATNLYIFEINYYNKTNCLGKNILFGF